MFRALSRSASALLVASALVAQTPARSPTAVGDQNPSATVDALHQAGKNVTINLLTMGTGKAIWELFGHNAIWIHDNVTGRDTVFNWGVFNFRQEKFLVRYLQGRRLYAMGSDSLPWIMMAYRYLNRSVLAQELDLTATQRDSVLRQIQWYARPENVNYRYDDFLDNCSTRVRDIIDNAVGGQMKAQAGALTGTTYRSHALRLTQVIKLLAVGVDIGLGRPSDRELTKWQTMFLPRELHDFVSKVQVRDGTGATHPLVRRDTVLFQATRPPEPATPPRLWVWMLAAGLLFAGLLAWLGLRAGAGARWARVTSGITVGIWAFVVGLLGTVLTLLWAVTDHWSAHANENLLLFNPLWVLLAVLASHSLWTGRPSRWGRLLAQTTAGLCLVALVAHVVRLSAQDNLALIGLTLPPALAIVWLLLVKNRVSSRGSTATEGSAFQSSR